MIYIPGGPPRRRDDQRAKAADDSSMNSDPFIYRIPGRNYWIYCIY